MAKRARKTGGPKAEPSASAKGAEPLRGKVTINDVARLANVSKKTVSRVINRSPLVHDETRKIVEAVIEEHGYSPDPQARALAFRRSFLVGMVYDNPSPQYVVNMQRGILDGIEGTNYQLALRPCDRADPATREIIRAFVVQHKPHGVILTPSVSEDDVLAEMLRGLNCKYVRIASVELDEPQRMVRTHDAEGAEQAADHIASLGHKVIAHIHGPKSFRSAHERLTGFKRGLKAHGLSLDKKMTVEGAYTFDSGLDAAEKLFRLAQRPTAIFAGNDEMAVAAYQAARQNSLRVPEDVSIVGFDDTPMASRVWPPMTTVRLPIREMGKAAASLLVDDRHNRDGTIQREFRPQLVIRQSSAPLR